MTLDDGLSVIDVIADAMACVRMGQQPQRRRPRSQGGSGPYCWSMRGQWKVVGASFAVALSLVGCSSPSPENVVSYEHFRFTCCANDLQQAWHSGEGIPLQWIAESAGRNSERTGQLVTLTAVLTGPYASVAVLKAGSPYTRSPAAQPLLVTDRMSGDPVSSIDLPIDLPVGWYNLAFTIKSAGGKVGSATVVQVTSLSP
jgi:hypothetical protein